MNKPEFPLCWFDRHTPIRDRSKWDGTHFVSICRFCGTGIRRRGAGRWHKDWEPDDHDGQPAWF